MNKKAQVVGGGIGGLAVAACLAKRGWYVTLHERAKELREIGAGIYLKENSLRVLEAIDHLEEVLRHGHRIESTTINDRPGHDLRHVVYGKARVYTIMREDLHQELADAARKHGVEIILGSEALSASETGSLKTSAGSFEGDLVIGADGVGSVVRKTAGLNRKIVRLPFGSTRFLIDRKPEDTLHTSIEYWRGHKRIYVSPMNQKTLYICASSREDDARGAKTPLDMAHWAEAFPELADIFTREPRGEYYHVAHPYVRTSGWYRGRVALIGDAAHGQPPNLGQGAGMSISNGHALVEALERLPLDRALASWEAEFRPFSIHVQTWSVGWDNIMHRWPRWLERARGGFVKSLAAFPPTARHWKSLYAGTPRFEDVNGRK